MDDPKIDSINDVEAETAPEVTAIPVTLPAAVPTTVDAKSAGAFRVVDADTGETLERVIEADSAAGTVKRYAVKNGNLVREDDHFVVIEEQRAVRIEAIDE